MAKSLVRRDQNVHCLSRADDEVGVGYGFDVGSVESNEGDGVVSDGEEETSVYCQYAFRTAQPYKIALLQLQYMTENNKITTALHFSVD